jgi:hypothetical protein
MKSFRNIFFVLTLLLSLTASYSCLKGEFDTPPIMGSDPSDITPDQIVSLTDVMKKFVPGKITPIAIDKYLKAVVVADDKSGNFYKTLIVEDENSDLGIAVLIDENEIHTFYAVGRRVFINLKDLSISDYNGLPQIGLGTDTGSSTPRLGSIPATLYKTIVRSGQFNIPVEPRVKKISELGPNDLNTLIKLVDVQFNNFGPNVYYADNTSSSPQSINHDLKECTGGAIIVRNSGFADFAGEVLPDKMGSLTAVYSIFRTDKQMFIRDTRDIVFDKERCGPGGGGSGGKLSVKDVRALFTGSQVNAPSGFVQGVVISDVAGKNINGQNLVVQDGDAGIILRFTSAISIPQGTEIKVNVGGLPISEFRGVLQIQNIPNTNAQVIGPATITPKQITASQADPATLESTLVKLVDVELSGDTKYSTDKLFVKDASGQVLLYTASGATFAGQNIKTGKVTVTAIVSEFDGTRQLQIRNLSDVVGDGSGCDTGNAALDCDGDGVANGTDCAPNDSAIYPNAPCNDNNVNTTDDKYNASCQCVGTPSGGGGGALDETFSSQSNNQDINLAGWVNVAVKGARKWQGKIFSGNTYAQATAFNDVAAEMETWMITPSIATGTTPNLSFETAKAFWKHDGLTVWVTTNFTGDPATTQWTQITTAKIAQQADADNAFIPSGNVKLDGFGANVRIGFKYVGDKATNTSTYRVDNVKVN